MFLYGCGFLQCHELNCFAFSKGFAQLAIIYVIIWTLHTVYILSVTFYVFETRRPSMKADYININLYYTDRAVDILTIQ